MTETTDIIKEQHAAVRRKYKSLTLETRDDGLAFVKGELHFSASYNGKLIEDRYNIELAIPSDYPDQLPKVKETGGRIPQSFHRYEDETLCLGAPLQVKMKFRENPTLVGFIEDQVIPYLYSYSYFEKTGKMPFGELPHRGEGITEYYQGLLQLETEIVVLGFLRILADDDYRGHHDCPCDSGKKLRGCHGQQLLKIKTYQRAEEFYLEYLQVANYLKESGVTIPNSHISRSLIKRFRKTSASHV